MTEQHRCGKDAEVLQNKNVCHGREQKRVKHCSGKGGRGAVQVGRGFNPLKSDT